MKKLQDLQPWPNWIKPTLMIVVLATLVAAGYFQIVTFGIVTLITSDQFNPIPKKTLRLVVITITPFQQVLRFSLHRSTLQLLPVDHSTTIYRFNFSFPLDRPPKTGGLFYLSFQFAEIQSWRSISP